MDHTARLAIFILIILIGTTVGGIVLVIKGIHKKKAYTGWLGVLLLSIVTLLIWFLLALVSGIGKVGG